MGLNEEVQRLVKVAYIEPARRRGESTIRIKAGDVHRELHWVNRVPSVCTTLSSRKFQEETGLKLIQKDTPPSGMGTRAVYVYRLSEHGTRGQGQKPERGRLEALYGSLAGVFHELGGAEKFIRDERQKLHFVKGEYKEEQ